MEGCLLVGKTQGNLVLAHSSRAVYGDWQTPPQLAQAVCQLLSDLGCKPHFVHEPSCGRGNFIYAALQTFPCLRQINGIEIYRPYILILMSYKLTCRLPPCR